MADTSSVPLPGWMGYSGIDDLSKVTPSFGCGLPSTQPVQQGTWNRVSTLTDVYGPGVYAEYFVKVPVGYNRNTPYKLVIAASTCVDEHGRAQQYSTMQR